jgi:hypothetical protein
VTLVGRGTCEREGELTPRSVRSFRFDPGALQRLLCPGDSGAPLIQGSPGFLGGIAGVASGHASTTCAAEAPDRMLFGDTVTLRAAIRHQLLLWLQTP